MKKVFALTLTLLMAFTLLTGCQANPTQAETSADQTLTEAEQSDEEQQGQETNGSHKVGLIISTLNNPFFVALKEGAEAETSENNIELIILDSQNDSAKELANMEDLLTQGVDLILINPTDSDAVGGAIEMANQKQIPVITLDRGANAGEVVAHIASDNIAGGILAGEFIAEKIGDSGKVVELQGIAGTSAARDRGKGFNDAIATTKIEVVAQQVANFDRTEGLNVMENILQAQPEINAVFAHNDEMALGALQAIEATDREIIVVGFDATDDALQAVKDKRMAATVAQQPDLIGRLGVKTALQVIGGEKVESSIPVELKLVTE